MGRGGYPLETLGVVTLEEINKANNDMYGSPKFDHIHYQIVDLLEVERFDMNLTEAAIPASTDFSTTSYIQRMEVALVANPPFTREICLTYVEESQALHSPWDFQIFDTLKEAQVWVGN